MTDLNPLLVMLLVGPLVGCLAIAFGAPGKRTALVVVLFNLAASLFLASGFVAKGGGFAYEVDTLAFHLQDLFTIHFHLGMDGLNLPMVLLTTIVSVAAVAVAPETVKKAREFFICLLLVSAGALGAFLSLDLFFLYVFHEVALIPTFLLIGIWGTHDRKFAATQLTLYLTLGSMVLLAGLFAFYFSLPEGSRSFDLVEIQKVLGRGRGIAESRQVMIFPLLLVGFGILISLWPFHSWAPKGYAASPVSAVMMHAGVLKKFGLYGLIRLAVPYLPEGMEHWMTWVLVLLLFNIIYIGLVTISQKDLNMMLGYSSVMHMGYLFLGLASANVIGLSGMVVLMVAHGLSAALLFGLAGTIRERTGTLRFQEMGGLAAKAPVLSILFIFGAMAALGLPGLGNFAGEMMIFFGGWKAFASEAPWVVVLAVWGVVISAVYLLRAVRSIFFGEGSPKVEGAGDLTDGPSRAPYLMLVVALVWVGFCPSLITGWVEPVVSLMLR